MKVSTSLSVLLAVAVLSACSGASSSTDTQAASETNASASGQASSASAEATKSSGLKCQEVPRVLLRGIASGAESGVGKLRITDGAAVRAPGYKKVFLIAGKFTAPGVDGEVGVWASNSLQAGGGIIVAVDGMAQQFTVWPDGDSIASPVPNGTEGQGEVKDCLK